MMRSSSKRGCSAGGLRGEHVEGGAGDLPRAHGFEQVVLVDDAATGRVHEAHAVLHGSELLAGDHAAGGGGQGGVHADEVALGVEAADLDGFGAEGADALDRDERVIGDDVHLEGEGATGHLGTDRAEADEAEGAAAKLGAHKVAAAPLAAAQGTVGAGDVASKGDEQGESVLGGGDGVAARRVHDHDAALGGGLKIDVIHPGAGAGDDLEAAGVGEGVGRDLGLAAHHEGLVAGQGLAELPGREAGADVNLRLLLEQGQCLRRRWGRRRGFGGGGRVRSRGGLAEGKGRGHGLSIAPPDVTASGRGAVVRDHPMGSGRRCRGLRSPSRSG